MGSTPGRNTASWQRLVGALRARWAEQRRSCWLCLQPIDYDLPSSEPGSLAADHVQPLSVAPHLAEVASNLAPAHRRCNESRGNGYPLGLGSTSRQW